MCFSLATSSNFSSIPSPGEINNLLSMFSVCPRTSYQSSKRRWPGGILMRCPNTWLLVTQKSIDLTPSFLFISIMLGYTWYRNAASIFVFFVVQGPAAMLLRVVSPGWYHLGLIHWLFFKKILKIELCSERRPSLQRKGRLHNFVFLLLVKHIERFCQCRYCGR